MFLLILLFSYCLWAIDHLQSDLQPSKRGYELTNGFPHGWPYPDKAFPYLCNLDITTPGPFYDIPWDSLRQLEYSIKSTYAPLFGGICLCLGVLMPVSNKTKEEAIRRSTGKLSATSRTNVLPPAQPSICAQSEKNSTPKSSPPPNDQNS
jgi:hypothetical protein